MHRLADALHIGTLGLHEGCNRGAGAVIRGGSAIGLRRYGSDDPPQRIADGVERAVRASRGAFQRQPPLPPRPQSSACGCTPHAMTCCRTPPWRQSTVPHGRTARAFVPVLLPSVARLEGPGAFIPTPELVPGRERVRQFSWDASARRMLEVCEEVAGGKG